MLSTQGTHVSRSCDSVAQNATRACGAPYDQCGGAPSPQTYKGKVVGYDYFKGPRCCEQGSWCNQANAYFHQCVPNNTGDHAYDFMTDLGLLPKSGESCAANGRVCGGMKGLYGGPFSCCSGKDQCVWLNSYVSLCLQPDQIAAEKASFGANLAAQKSVVAGWQAARTPPPPAKQR